MRNSIWSVGVLPAAVLLAGPAQAQEGPELEFLYRATVALGETIDVGETALGNRRIIPISGGTFEGPEIRGEVLPMGWDWQLDQSDGCTLLVADYFIRTDDDVVINVVNSGVMCSPDVNPDHAARTTSPVFEPPLGKYEWLGQGTYVGTVSFDPGIEERHVIITVYKAD